jgi:5'-nucleotidase
MWAEIPTIERLWSGRMRISTLAMCLVLCLTTACGESSTAGERLRVMVTNDDGVSAPGIAALVDALAAHASLEVTVFAPAANSSGSGDTISTDRPVTVTSAMTASGYPATAVRTTAGDASLFGILQGLPAKPDLVVSGVNDGLNVGDLVYGPGLVNSGTVGAALWAARFGIPAIAVSQGAHGTSFANAAAYAAEVVERFRTDSGFRQLMLNGNAAGRAVVLNVNFPTCTAGTVRGVRVVPLGRSVTPVGYTLQTDSDTQSTYMLVTTTLSSSSSDCTSTLANPTMDVEAVSNGFASVTPLGTDATLAGDPRRFQFLER